MRAILIALTAVLVASGQTAITSLSSFWEMNVTSEERIAWDSHGQAHGRFTGHSVALEPQTTVFGGGFKISHATVSTAGMSVPASLVNTSGSWTLAIWCRVAGGNYVAGRRSGGTNYWTANFSASSSGRFQALGQVMPSGAYNKNTGDLALVWMAYDADANQVRIAVDDSAWTSGSPQAAYSNDNDAPLDFGHLARVYGPGVTVGLAMYWTGYLPDSTERSDIYNGGDGQDYSYFSATPFTPPSRPLSVTYQGVIADDADLTGQQGLYFLRPFPLCEWKPSFVATYGAGCLIWVRSTDHQAGSNAGGIWTGITGDTPTVPPASWTLVKDATALSTETGQTWYQLETPHLEYDPDTGYIHLYAHAARAGTSSPVQQATHVWRSSDIAAWTYHSEAFPRAAGRNHTGYATVTRRGTGDWVANTLCTDSGASPPSLNCTWSSTDGLAWNVDREELATADTIFSAVQGPYSDWGRWSERINLDGAVYLLGYNIAPETANTWEGSYPSKPLIEHPTPGSFLQEARVYVDDCDVYIYGKLSYQEPSQVGLWTGTLTGCTPDEPAAETGIWPDRRPIGAAFIANYGHRSATNPRGYGGSTSHDFLGAGFSSARTAVLNGMDTLLDSADLYNPKPQGVCVWDIEGQEFQHVFSYAGNPQLLSVLAPEMETETNGVPLADEIMSLIRSRGYIPCLTLRPHKILSGTGRPTNGCMSQSGANGQAYIDTAASYPNRGYRCGPAASTVSGDTWTATGEFSVNYQSGSVVRFVSTGTLPSPLVSLEDYYLCDWDNTAKTFRVATDSGCSSIIPSYTGGSGTHTMMSWRGPADLSVQELPSDATDAYDTIKAKVEYSLGRWGSPMLFYVDSPYYCANASCQSDTVITDAVAWQQLRTDFPHILLMPEYGATGLYSAKYLSFNNGDYKRSSSILDTYPYYFPVVHIQDTTPGYLDWRDEIKTEMKAGVPYMLTLNTAPGANANGYYKDDQETVAREASCFIVTNSATDRPLSFCANPHTAFTYPLKLRVYFASSSDGLTASTTYCDADCTVNLTGMTHYQKRYYTYTGALVSNPGVAETLQ